MDSKIGQSAVLLVCFLGLVGCNTKIVDTENEHLVGARLEAIAPLKASDGNQKNKIVIFDETIHKIHEFDLFQMKCTRSLDVLFPTLKHFVLNDEEGNYIVDFTEKSLSVFDKNSNRQSDAISFVGKPVSAAFRPDLGYLVMYDDLKNISLLKILPDGHIAKARVFGALANGVSTISAGDLTDDGRLVLGLSDNSILIVDIEASLNQPSNNSFLVSSAQATNLSAISWLGQVPNKPGLFFLKADGQVALYNINTGSVLQTLSVGLVSKYSKSGSPHMIDYFGDAQNRLIYTDGNSIKTILLYMDRMDILSSDVDLTLNAWTTISLPSYTGDYIFGDVDANKKFRNLKKFQLSSMMAIQSKPLPDNTQIKIGNDFIFALFPSELGYAEKISILNQNTTSIKQFNLKSF
jgi:hypothetical protein